MTLPAALAHIEYIGDGSTVAFTYPFKITTSAEIEVRRDGSLDTETVSYSVSGAGTATGGTVTYFVAPAQDVVVSLRRVVLFEQLLALIANGALPSQAIEFRFDQIVKMVQQLEEELSRRLGFAVGASAALRYLLFPEPGAGKLIGWNALGTELTLYDPSISQVVPVAVSGIAYGQTSVAVPSVAGQYLLTVTALAPVGVEVLGVTYYCTIDFSAANGLTSLNIGGFGIEDRWGLNVGITAGTVTTPGNFRLNEHVITASATDIVLTANGGSFGPTGSAIVTVHWQRLVAPTTL